MRGAVTAGPEQAVLRLAAQRAVDLTVQVLAARSEVAAKASTIESLQAQYDALRTAEALAVEALSMRVQAAEAAASAVPIERVWGSVKTLSDGEREAALEAAHLMNPMCDAASPVRRRIEQRRKSAKLWRESAEIRRASGAQTAAFQAESAALDEIIESDDTEGDSARLSDEEPGVLELQEEDALGGGGGEGAEAVLAEDVVELEFAVRKVHRLRGKLARRFVVVGDTFATYSGSNATNLFRFSRNFLSAEAKPDASGELRVLRLEVQQGAMRRADLLRIGVAKKKMKQAVKDKRNSAKARASAGGRASGVDDLSAAAKAARAAVKAEKRRYKPRARHAMTFECASVGDCARLVEELNRRARRHGRVRAPARWLPDGTIVGVELSDQVVHALRGRGVVAAIDEAGDPSRGGGECCVHVEFVSGETHRYNKAAWKAKLRFATTLEINAMRVYRS